MRILLCGIFSLIIFLLGTLDVYAVQKEAGTDNGCGELRCVEKIEPKNGHVFITFDLACPMFQVIGKIGKKGEFISLKRQAVYELTSGEGIKWGDGDHASQSIVVSRISPSQVFLEIGDQFSWPGEKPRKRQCAMVIHITIKSQNILGGKKEKAK